MEHKITHLPKDEWKGHILPIKYTADEYYDVKIASGEEGFRADFIKKRFPLPVTHTPEEYDFPDKLYEDWWEKAYVWGVAEGGKLLAAIETCPEEYSNRLRVTELWVDESCRHCGIAHSLMDIAKEQARLERRRAVILETQSCNVNAIGFYLHEGFTLIGFDSCCYSNNDLERKEVRLELGWFPPKKEKLKREDIEIRKETPEDYYSTELMTRDAFWNKHHQGCDEHYLVHKLRDDKSYIPELSRVAVKDGKVIGYIMYSTAFVKFGRKKTEVLTFGPLCVSPEWQGCGVGGLLFEETMRLAAEKGYKGIVIFGEPDYYPLHGFVTCDKYFITTADGKNFSAFMAKELVPGGFDNVKGKFYESKVFENLPEAEVEEYNKLFPYAEKIKFPFQWD